MASIPLLKFPIIIIEDILKQITPLELVRLSVCNKNLRLFIAKQKCVMNWTLFPKDVLRSFDCIEFMAFLRINMINSRFIDDKELVMSIDASTLSIFVGKPSKSFCFISRNIETLEKYVPTLKFVTFLNHTVPCLSNDQKLWTFWNNKMDGFKTLISFFVNTFKIKVRSIDLSTTCEMIHTTRNIALLDWMRSTGLKSGSCSQIILNDARKKGTYPFPLDVLEPANDSNLDEIKSIRLNVSHWFTIDNLLSYNFEAIILERSRITSNQIRIFIDHWLEGKFPRLKHLRVENPNINFFRILKNLAATPKHQKNGKNYKSFNGMTHSIYEARDLLRPDGVQATIRYPISCFVPKTFDFFVWPDFEGNNL